MPLLSLPDADLYHERSGEGPPLLFLNGSGATIEGSGLLLAPFRERFDLLVGDQRALGRSPLHEGAPTPTMADYAADGIALADAQGWDRFAVAGISFGGMVAQELAVTWPDRVARLGLACTSPGGEGGSSYPLHELADRPAEERAEIGTRLLDTRFTPEWLAGHPSDAGLARYLVRQADAGGSGGGSVTGAAARTGEAAQLAARSAHDVWDRLPRITAPTLVACGRYDGIAPPRNSEAIASRIAGAELRCYEGGHAFFVQDPVALPEILDFLAAG